MKLDWDYTCLADAYRKRPPYSQVLLNDLAGFVGRRPGLRVCDIGAGTGNLTVPLAEWGCEVAAVEPNAAMRAIGRERTAAFPMVAWHSTVAEETGLPARYFDLVAFGSSFNVVKRTEALKETCRILRQRGWLTCLWNFRDLNDPLQLDIERLIRSFLPDYQYGSRRENQVPLIEESGLFRVEQSFERNHVQMVDPAEWLEAWRSHATLQRQAGDRFQAILQAIEALLPQPSGGSIEVRYVTRAWLARKLE